MTTAHKRSTTLGRVSVLCVWGIAVMLAAACSGSDGTTTPTSPSSPTSPTSPSSPAPPTTPATPGNFSVQMMVSGGDCTATSNTPVSCTFVAQVTGGQGPFTYTWEFWTENDTRVTMQGQSVRPTLDCRFSSGQAQFRVYMSVRVDEPGGGSATASNDQRILRAAGHC